MKKRISKDDTTECIKTLKRSVYSIVEQLKKQHAQVTISSFLLLSKRTEMHC